MRTRQTTVKPRFQSRRHARAFTLIEVLIVLAIVLALSAIVGVAVFGRQDEAKEDLAQVDLNNVESALRLFRLDFDRYPTDDEGLAILWSPSTLDAESEETSWNGPYLEQAMPSDRWGNEWGYRAESEYGAPYDLWSNGPDGEEGTEDDITSWTEGQDGEGFDDFGTGGDFAAPPPPPPAGDIP